MKNYFVKLNSLFFFSLSLFVRIDLSAQCGTSISSGGFRSAPLQCGVENYTDLNTANMTDKVIRVTIHVFQNEAPGNPQNFDPYNDQGAQTSHYTWLRNLVYSASSWMGSLQTLNYNNGSPLITDSRIRFDCVQVCEWKNNDFWARNWGCVANFPTMRFK